MKGGIRIGKILGIKIRLDWSWLLIFALVSWNLTTAFGQMHPDWNLYLQVGTAVAAALLFFGSVLAHELAHSLVARARGMPVKGITLFLFGGVSNIQENPPSPGAEFWMAIVGPITSFVLGLIFTLLSGLGMGSLSGSLQDPTSLAAGLGPVTTLLLWLGPVNLTLAVFNMVPGFPLDGGRVLRSILWKVTDNLKRATRWASWVGQTIAWLLITGGIAMVFGVTIPIFGSGLVNGLWLMFIGWFLNSASVQSYQRIVIQDVLEGVPVRDMMREDVPTVGSDITIRDLVHDYIMGEDDHTFPVVDEGRLVGLITLDDVRDVSRERWDQVRVHEVMTPEEDVVTVSTSDEAADAFERLTSRDVRQLPVLSGEQLAGALSRKDIIRWLSFASERDLGQGPLTGQKISS